MEFGAVYLARERHAKIDGMQDSPVNEERAGGLGAVDPGVYADEIVGLATEGASVDLGVLPGLHAAIASGHECGAWAGMSG